MHSRRQHVPGRAAGRRADRRQQDAFNARIASYGLDGTNFLFSHERVTFGIRNTAALRRRFMIYSNAMEMVLDQLAARRQRAVVVQELGGFLSVIACFYAARKRGIRNWFIEPSFFRGRLYFTPDSFAAPDTMATPADAGFRRGARLSRRHLAASAPSSFRKRTGINIPRRSTRSPMPATPAASSKSCGTSLRSASIRNSATISGMRGRMRRWRSAPPG